MITPWDESYKRTKAIKTGAAQLEAPFNALVEWLNGFYSDIGALNAWVELCPTGPTPGGLALRVALERDAAIVRFRTAQLAYNPSEQDRVRAKFRSLAARLPSHAPLSSEMLVTFHAFEELARWEANDTVSDDDLAHLKVSLSDLSVWEIHRQHAGVTFFFVTDDQLVASERNGARQVCEQVYANVLRRYDEFGYFAERPIDARFYSKQSFDRVYHGNWFFFDR